MNILRAETYLKTRLLGSEKVADLYDDDEMLREALSTLFPDFEYPDFSYMTIDQVLVRYNKNPLPLQQLPS